VNTASARQHGLSDAQINALPDDVENEAFSDRDRAVLRACEQMALTNLHGSISDELHRALARHFSDAEIFELGVTMAVLCGFAKFLFCFDLADREENCPIHRSA